VIDVRGSEALFLPWISLVNRFATSSPVVLAVNPAIGFIRDETCCNSGLDWYNARLRMETRTIDRRGPMLCSERFDAKTIESMGGENCIPYGIHTVLRLD
jgi:hypothetical protein